MASRLPLYSSDVNARPGSQSDFTKLWNWARRSGATRPTLAKATLQAKLCGVWEGADVYRTIQILRSRLQVTTARHVLSFFAH